jgi:hypothetical protein
MTRSKEGRERIVSIVAVSLVTLLIWMWAAGETRETEPAFTDIRFVAPTADSMRILPGEISTLRLQVRGPRRAIDAVAEKLREPIPVTAGTNGVPSEPGPHEIDLALLGEAIVSQWRLPVTVVGAEPESMTIEILPLTTREVRVVPVLPSGVRTTGRIEVVPETATIVLPNDLAAIEDLQLEARVSDRDLAGRETGRRHQFEVPLQAPASLAGSRDSIRIQPRNAEVRLALDSNDAELTLSSPVPVQIAGPAADLDDWTVEVDPASAFLRDVVLRGPAETIQRLRDRDGDVGVIAFVHLTSDDLLKRIEEKPVTLWSLPAGVTVTSVGGDTTSSPRITLRIVERE